MIALWITLGIVAFLAIVFLILCYAAYRRAFYNLPNPNYVPYQVPNTPQYQEHKDALLTLIGELDSQPYESIYITSRDGLKLHAKYYHFCDGAPVHIDMHGYRSSGVRDFCGANSILKKLGHNAIIVDERAHSKSEGRTITFGIKERYDCLDWINYAVQRFGADTPIFISGVSMGAGTVLMTVGLDLPKNVKGVFADCPFSAPWDIIKKVCKDIGLPHKLCFPFGYVAAGFFGGFKLTETSAKESVKRARIPILIIHGDDDRLVPHDMSVEIRDANPEMVKLVTIHNAGHALAYFRDPEFYERTVIEFFNDCLLEK